MKVQLRRDFGFKVVCAVSILLFTAMPLMQSGVLAGCGADRVTTGPLPPPPPPPPLPPQPPPPPRIVYDPTIISKPDYKLPPGVTGTGATSLSPVVNDKREYATTIEWAYDLGEMLVTANSKNQPYVLYFCTEPIGKVTGEGPDALEKYKKANNGACPNMTPFDNPQLVQWFHASGIGNFAKIVVNDANKKIVEARGASVDHMQICAPDGEKLGEWIGVNCNDSAILNFLRNDFKQKWESWNTKRSGRKALDAEKAGVQPVVDARLLSAWRFSPKLISGGAAETEESFKALKELGVKTIISVEGSPSDIEQAQKYGMSCVQIPVSYNGITSEKAARIARAVRDLPGPVYIHCRCGLNRSAAAAAIAQVTLGEMTSENATNALKSIGTEEYFKGLYECVAGAKPLSKEELDKVSPDFKAEAEVTQTVKAMSQIAAFWRRLDKAAKARFEDETARTEAGKLLTHCAALSFSDESSAYGEEYVRKLKESERLTRDFVKALDALKADVAKNSEPATKLHQQLGASCNACHQQFRDHARAK